jgi:hypothetical protein
MLTYVLEDGQQKNLTSLQNLKKNAGDLKAHPYIHVHICRIAPTVPYLYVRMSLQIYLL